MFSEQAATPEQRDTEQGFDRERHVVVNQEEVADRLVAPADLERGATTLTLELFDGERVSLSQTRARRGEVAAAAEAEWIGQTRDENGAILATASFAVHRDEETGHRTVSGLYQDGVRTILVEPVDGDMHRMVELDESELPEFRDIAIEAHSDQQSAESAEGSGTVTASAYPPGGATIRVLVAYANGVPAHTQDLVNTEIAWTNQALDASGIDASVSLVGFEPANYTPSSSLGTDLNRLQNSSEGFMDHLHGLRDQYDADLVALIVHHPSDACGVGYVPASTGSPTFGFSVSALDYCHYSYTFPHEIGHNLGANHDPSNASPTSGTFSYSRGHCATNVVRSVMAYSTPCGGNRALQFSNPSNTFVGHPSHASGTSTRDNARAIGQVAWPVSSYRETGPAGNDYLWRGLTNNTFSSTAPQNQETPHEPIAGDFDGDGNSDIFWYEPGEASDPVWYFNDSLGKSTYTENSNLTYTPLAGDFDGDGRDDVFWYRPGSGADYVWWGQSSRSNFGDVQHQKQIIGTYTPFVGDFDGDGRDDIFWYASGGANDYIFWGDASRSSFTSTYTLKSVSGTYTPLAGDFDGDGYDDAFWYAPGSSADWIWWGQASRSGFSSPQTYKTVNQTYEPAVGDFDADGRDDVFWYAPGTTSDWLWWGLTSRTSFGSSQTAHTVNGYYEARAGNFDSLQGEDVYWFQPG